MAVPGPATNQPTGQFQRRDRQRDLLANCRCRLESIERAVDHLKLNPPDEWELPEWEEQLDSLEAEKVRVTIRLDRLSSRFARADSQDVSDALATVKRLEGKLTNVCERFDLRLPSDM